MVSFAHIWFMFISIEPEREWPRSVEVT